MVRALARNRPSFHSIPRNIHMWVHGMRLPLLLRSLSFVYRVRIVESILKNALTEVIKKNFEQIT